MFFYATAAAALVTIYITIELENCVLELHLIDSRTNFKTLILIKIFSHSTPISISLYIAFYTRIFLSIGHPTFANNEFFHSILYRHQHTVLPIRTRVSQRFHLKKLKISLVKLMLLFNIASFLIPNWNGNLRDF